MPLDSASFLALASARTLKPITTALDAMARLMSLSEMPPTAACTTCTRTSSVDSLVSDCTSASCEPWTSVLTISARVCVPSPRLSNMDSSLAACWRASLTSRNLPWRNSAISRALRSSDSTISSSPAAGTSVRPWISTGIDGPASWMGLPFSSSMARTRRSWRQPAPRRRDAACRFAPGWWRPGRDPCPGGLR